MWSEWCAAFCIPVGTAYNERGFSDLKLHRTRLRILLGDTTMDELMRISLEGPQQHTPEYIALRTRVIEHWAGLKRRRCDQEFDMPLARRRRKKLAKAALAAEKARVCKKEISSRRKNAKRRARKRAAHKEEREKQEAEIMKNQAVVPSADPDSKVCVDTLDQKALAALIQSEESPSAEQAKNKRMQKEAKLKAAQHLRDKLLADYEKNDRPRRRVTSTRLLRAIRDRG